MSSSSSSSVIPPNQLKKKLSTLLSSSNQSASHQPSATQSLLLGTFLSEFRQPSVCQILKNAGLDYFTIDNEHGQYTIETITDLCRYAVLCGITPLCRVPDPNLYHLVAQTLDAGAQGLMLPRIYNTDQLKEILSYIYFPPKGVRGNAQMRAYTQFQAGNVIDTMNTSNENLVIIVQIETVEALNDIENIAAVDGIDILLIGPNDLSIALNTAPDINGQVMQDAIKKVMTACRKHHKVAAIHHDTLALAQYWIEQGIQCISVNSEAGFMYQAANEAVKKLRG